MRACCPKRKLDAVTAQPARPAESLAEAVSDSSTVAHPTAAFDFHHPLSELSLLVHKTPYPLGPLTGRACCGPAGYWGDLIPAQDIANTTPASVSDLRCYVPLHPTRPAIPPVPLIIKDNPVVWLGYPSSCIIDPQLPNTAPGQADAVPQTEYGPSSEVVERPDLAKLDEPASSSDLSSLSGFIKVDYSSISEPKKADSLSVSGSTEFGN